MKVTETDQQLKVVFEGDLNIFQITEIYADISRVLHTPRPKICIDLSEVELMDTTGFQLLMYMQKVLEENEKSYFYLPDRSHEVEKILDYYGYSLKVDSEPTDQ